MSIAIAQWLQRPAVQQRLEDLRQGHQTWTLSRKIQRPFPGGPYVLLHTLSHLLIRSLAMRCGYPASSIRERIYVEDGAEGVRYGILLYTGVSGCVKAPLFGEQRRARSGDRRWR